MHDSMRRWRARKSPFLAAQPAGNVRVERLDDLQLAVLGLRAPRVVKVLGRKDAQAFAIAPSKLAARGVGFQEELVVHTWVGRGDATVVAPVGAMMSTDEPAVLMRVGAPPRANANVGAYPCSMQRAAPFTIASLTDSTLMPGLADRVMNAARLAVSVTGGRETCLTQSERIESESDDTVDVRKLGVLLRIQVETIINRTKPRKI